MSDNQQPEVSAAAHEAAPDTITHYILLIQGVPKEFIELKDFNRATEKLREEHDTTIELLRVYGWLPTESLQMFLHRGRDVVAERDQLRAELEACEKREADLLYQGKNDYTRLDQIADHLDFPYSLAERKAGHSGGAPVRHAIAALRAWQDTEATLRAENEALRKDRERLDWLEEYGDEIFYYGRYCVGEPKAMRCERSRIDAAIAAMSKGEAK